MNGSVAGTVIVNGPGTLGGTGVIGGNLAISGMLAPGNSIGTLTVSGHATQNAGNTYQVEINVAGQSDRLTVQIGARPPARQHCPFRAPTARNGLQPA